MSRQQRRVASANDCKHGAPVSLNKHQLRDSLNKKNSHRVIGEHPMQRCWGWHSGHLVICFIFAAGLLVLGLFLSLPLNDAEENSNVPQQEPSSGVARLKPNNKVDGSDSSSPSFGRPEWMDAKLQHSRVQTGWINEKRNLIKERGWEYLQEHCTSTSANVRTVEPFVVRNQEHELRRQWRLFDADLYSMAKEEGVILEGARWQPEPVFVLGRERERGGMLMSKPESPQLQYYTVSLLDFLLTIPNADEFFYWTGPLSAWRNTSAAQRNAECVSDLSQSEQRKCFDWTSLRIFEPGISSDMEGIEENKNESLWTPMLWLSHPGVVSQTHYDTQHNMFVQLQGRKRFLLFSPETELYMYPHIHYSHRQSQVRFDKQRVVVEPFAHVSPTSTTAMEVVLEPGDLLYIPPYWQHHVTSQSISLSLSVLSPAQPEAQLAELYWMKVPFGSFQSEERMRKAAVYFYLSLLIEELFLVGVLPKPAGDLDAMQAFADLLYASRFKPLLYQHKIDDYVGSDCCSSDNTGSDSCDHCAVEVATEAIDEENRKMFANAARNFGRKLALLPASPGIKRSFLFNYAEEIIRWAVGPERTIEYLRCCLATRCMRSAPQ